MKEVKPRTSKPKETSQGKGIRYEYKLLLGILAVFVVLVISWFGYRLYPEIRQARAWRAMTSPLPAETVEDLCAQFDLPPDERLCRPGARVYAPEFNRRINLIFRGEGASWSQKEVDEKLKDYEVGCDPPFTEDGVEYLRCTYDLRGDGVYPLTIYYTYADGTIESVHFFYPD